MKFNEQQNKSLEELYRIARDYIHIAQVINQTADDIKNEECDNSMNNCFNIHVRAKTNYIEDTSKVLGINSEKLKTKLNDVRKAFKD